MHSAYKMQRKQVSKEVRCTKYARNQHKERKEQIIAGLAHHYRSNSYHRPIAVHRIFGCNISSVAKDLSVSSEHLRSWNSNGMKLHGSIVRPKHSLEDLGPEFVYFDARHEPLRLKVSYLSKE